MDYFSKINSLNNDSLYKEARGLELLNNSLKNSKNNYIKIPKIFSVEKDELKLEKIDSQPASHSSMRKFAVGLAKLHKIEFTKFGLNEDNYIGLNVQKNILSDNWGLFFYEYRLLFQVNMITNEKIKNNFISIVQNNKNNIISLLNETSHPSLLHGDLWSGNVIFTNDEVYMIDPAVYYGDREVDIAMSEVFGGFSAVFYNTYNENLPLSKYYEKKKVIYNLYHYLNHYNLFGSSYLNSIISSLETIKTI